MVTRHPWKEFRAHRVILAAWVGVVVLNLLHWALVVYKNAPSDLPIFLHYNTILGVDVTGSWYGLFVMPLSGTVILVVNFFLSLLYDDHFTPPLAVTMALLCELGLIASSVLLFIKNA